MKLHKKLTAACVLALCGIILAGCSASSMQSHVRRTLTEQASGIIAEAQEPVKKEEIKELKNQNIGSAVRQKMDGYWTVACFGLDSREDNELLYSNSDVIMLMALNKESGEVSMMSVYRDTCLKTGNKYKKANYAYVSGGPVKAITMLNENLDLEIDDYAVFNWKAVATGINMLGGVTVDISEKEMEAVNKGIPETSKVTGIESQPLKRYGEVELDGVQAVAYCRIRKIDDDFVRTERQRKVLSLMLAKAKHTNVITLRDTLKTVIPMIGTSVDDEDIDVIIDNMARLKLKDAGGFPYEKYTKDAHGADYVFANGLAENVSMAHRELYGDTAYTPSDTVYEIESGIRYYSKD